MPTKISVSGPRFRILLGDDIAIGPGKADLLQKIIETGSISAAAREMDMSYRRAWLLVDTMNHCFSAPLVETATGGRRGGGAQVSTLGLEVLQRYREMERVASEAVTDHMADFSKLMTPG